MVLHPYWMDSFVTTFTKIDKNANTFHMKLHVKHVCVMSIFVKGCYKKTSQMDEAP